MSIIEIYFIFFIVATIGCGFSGIPVEDYVSMISKTYTLTNVLIASVGYGICKRLDKLINKK